MNTTTYKMRIVNLRNYALGENEVLVYVDRRSVLGNPFFISDKRGRAEVCDAYLGYAKRKMSEGGAFYEEVKRIAKLLDTKNVALGCWCSPLRCHSETIVALVDSIKKCEKVNLIEEVVNERCAACSGDSCGYTGELCDLWLDCKGALPPAPVVEVKPVKVERVIIAGSRSIVDFALLEKAIKDSGFKIDEVVCGMAQGVDEMGFAWARRHNVPVREFPAKWEQHGKSAGFKRNLEMAQYATALILVWDGESRGSGNMLMEAVNAGLKIHALNTKPVVVEEPLPTLPFSPSSNKRREYDYCDTEEEVEVGEAVISVGDRECPLCGNELNGDTRCSECGASLDKSTVAVEILLGSEHITKHILTEEKMDKHQFRPTCSSCGEDLVGKACPCGFHKGTKVENEKRPEVVRELHIPSYQWLFAHADSCRCDDCSALRRAGGRIIL